MTKIARSGIIVAIATVAFATVWRLKMPAVMKKINNITRCQDIYRARMLDEGLSSRQYSVLLLVSRKPGLSQEFIARELCFDKSGASRVLSALEERGYVTREQNLQNKREFIINPTDRAMKIVPQIREVTKAWNDFITEGIAEDELEIFRSVMSRLEARARILAKGERE